uniref:Major facilitator superfamily (MFS) profile domain-containing protein n=1 Tax=Parascaris univalens TaxID=6257 RepID=A0A915C1G7_PARUN
GLILPNFFMGFSIGKKPSCLTCRKQRLVLSSKFVHQFSRR